MDKNRMDNKAQLRYSGKVMRHWYWCVLVVLLQLVLTAAVLYVNTLAGCIVGGFTVVLILSLVLLDVHYRSRVLIELMDFAHKFSGIEKEMLKNFLVPYAIVQPDGKLVWMNDMMAELTGKDADYHKIYLRCFRL